jgi:hypothetical protein
VNGYKAVAGLEDDHGHGPTGPSRRRSQGSGPHPVEIVAYDSAWPARLAELGRNLRAGLGEVALRIDHISSTSVPGLAAKPIIDIQISVADFEPLAAYRPSPATSCAARPTSTTAGRAVGAGVSRPVRQTPVATLDPRWIIREAGLVVGCAAGNEVTAHLLLSTGEWGRAGAVPLSMAEFVTRDPRPRPVAGRRAGAAGRVRGSQPWRPGLQLTGFVIFCCAADAEAL